MYSSNEDTGPKVRLAYITAEAGNKVRIHQATDGQPYEQRLHDGLQRENDIH
jgi:hypothetical protein